MNIPTDPPQHDSFAKELFGIILEKFGTTEAQHAVLSPAQYADIWFMPNKDAPPTTHPMLELIAQMGQGPGIFEPFRETPNLDSCLDILNKALSLHRRRRPSSTSKDPDYQRAHAWILSPGIPETGLAQLAAHPDTQNWRPGFYALPPGLKTHVVVLSELPSTEETLIFRLMGRKKTQKTAMEQLQRVVPDKISNALIELVLQWRIIELNRPWDALNEADMELIMNSKQLVQQYKQQIHTQGRQEGHQEGRHEGSLSTLVCLIERRIKRTILPHEHTSLAHQLRALGLEEVLDQCLNLEPQQLIGWLELPHDPA